MHKAILVDDELLDLRGLSSSELWGELLIDVVATFTDGLEALRFMSKNAVDILITDIKMPQMMGLDLAKQAQEFNTRLKVIIISGYENFSYAKTALSLKASGYLLKPVDETELKAVLENTISELNNNKALSLKDTGSFQSSKNELLCQWLKHGVTDHTVLEDLRKYGVVDDGKPCVVAIVEFDDYRLKEHTVHSFHSDIEWISEMIVSSAKKAGIAHQSKLDHQKIALIIQDPSSLQVIDEIRREIHVKSSLTVTIGIGKNVASLYEICESYQSALNALNHKLFYGKNQMITQLNLNQQLALSVKDLDTIIDSMLESMSSYNLVGIDDDIQDIVTYLKGTEPTPAFSRLAIYVMTKWEVFLSKMHINLFEVPDVQLDHLEVLILFETVYDFQSWLRRKAFAVSEHLNQNKIKKKKRIINDIEQYVMSRLGSDITLRDVANYFSFTPNYLGIMFKDETGTNFSEFVIRIRMEYAAELLKNPSIKIYEVADKVGFKHINYFSRQFKEFFGVTPTDYRNFEG